MPVCLYVCRVKIYGKKNETASKKVFKRIYMFLWVHPLPLSVHCCAGSSADGKTGALQKVSTGKSSTLHHVHESLFLLALIMRALRGSPSPGFSPLLYRHVSSDLYSPHDSSLPRVVSDRLMGYASVVPHHQCVPLPPHPALQLSPRHDLE